MRKEESTAEVDGAELRTHTALDDLGEGGEGDVGEEVFWKSGEEWNTTVEIHRR